MHNEFKFDLPNDKHVIVFWCRKFVHACASVSSSRGIERYLLTRFYLFPLSQRQGCLFFPLDVEAGHGRIIRKRGVPSDAARVHRASWIRIRHFSVKNSSQHLWLSHVPDRQLLPVGWNRGALWNLFRMPRVGRGHDKREIKASFEEFLRSIERSGFAAWGLSPAFSTLLSCEVFLCSFLPLRKWRISMRICDKKMLRDFNFYWLKKH